LFRIKNLLILFLIILTFILLFPRKVTHAVVAGKYNDYTKVYINNRPHKVKLSKTYGLGTVLSYKYNLIGIFSLKEEFPLKDRIMKKNINTYDLEKKGPIPLASKPQYYFYDGKILIPSDSQKILVGKNNLNMYLDSKSKLKTFIITPEDYTNMRIGISTTKFSSIYHPNIEIECLSSALLYSLRENLKLDISKNSKITITPNTVLLNDKELKFKERIYLKGEDLRINSIRRGTPDFIPSYSGILEITPENDNELLIINEISLENYLVKVVPSEMPTIGGLESLKCQAIAARTYALSDMLQCRFAELGFYVDDSTQSQVYNNTPTNSMATEAVNLTKGLIMTNKDQPIDAKYYSTSPGLGTLYDDVWFKEYGTSENKDYYFTGYYINNVNKLPVSEAEWLQFFKSTKYNAIDLESPYFRWNVEIKKTPLEKSLIKSLKYLFENRKDYVTVKSNNSSKGFPQLKELKDIKVTNRSKYGNIIEISFIFSNATVNVQNDYNIRSAIRLSKDYTDEIIPIIRHKGEPLINNNFLPSSFFSIEKFNDTFIIYGGGYGHGVGMSQYGAMALSKSGKDFKSILNTYYKNISLTKLY